MFYLSLIRVIITKLYVVLIKTPFQFENKKYPSVTKQLSTQMSSICNLCPYNRGCVFVFSTAGTTLKHKQICLSSYFTLSSPFDCLIYKTVRNSKKILPTMNLLNKCFVLEQWISAHKKTEMTLQTTSFFFWYFLCPTRFVQYIEIVLQ